MLPYDCLEDEPSLFRENNQIIALGWWTTFKSFEIQSALSMEVSSSLPLTPYSLLADRVLFSFCFFLKRFAGGLSSEREWAGLKVSFNCTGKEQEEAEVALW